MNMNLKVLLLASSLALSALDASFSFNEIEKKMTKGEKRRTGIQKLNAKERQFIEDWLTKNETLYHFSAPTVSDVRDIRWMYESIRLKKPSQTRVYDESLMPYQTSVCASFQNCASRLKEWIEYHKQLGIQHFYLYNNLSTDEYVDVLNPYLEMGEVEIIQWPVRGPLDEESIYQNALSLAQGRSKWLLYLTTDEYLELPTKTGLIQFLEEQQRQDEVEVETSSNNRSITKPHVIKR